DTGSIWGIDTSAFPNFVGGVDANNGTGRNLTPELLQKVAHERAISGAMVDEETRWCFTTPGVWRKLAATERQEVRYTTADMKNLKAGVRGPVIEAGGHKVVA